MATYCGAYGLWAEATEAIQKFGVMTSRRRAIQCPYLASDAELVRGDRSW